MASLYIKDPEANALAEELASACGITKTAAVKMALSSQLKERRAKAAMPKRDVRAVIEQIWRDNGWTEMNGPPADKAFFDTLNDE